MSKGKSSDLLFNPDHQFTKKSRQKKSSKQLKIYFLRKKYAIVIVLFVIDIAQNAFAAVQLWSRTDCSLGVVDHVVIE